DELTGFIVAVSLVRPSKKIADVGVKSVKKKMKDKAFAAAVSREDIEKGADELGTPLDEHITNVLDAMKGIAEQLGL
ncbi:MAG TPA: HAD family hydrolase, partial [Spirochaetes bacterium]|nr:HAD family hydrolase [Spirochaetota bacterium]